MHLSGTWIYMMNLTKCNWTYIWIKINGTAPLPEKLYAWITQEIYNQLKKEQKKIHAGRGKQGYN